MASGWLMRVMLWLVAGSGLLIGLTRLLGLALPEPAWIATGQADGRIAVLDGRRGLGVTVIRDGALCDEIYARCGDVWSPGRDAFVYVQLDPTLITRPLGLAVFDLTTARSRGIRADSTAYNPVWLPDGSHIAYFARRDFRNPGEPSLILLDLASGSERELLPRVNDRYLEASPDGDWLAVVNLQRQLTIIHLETGGTTAIAQPAFSPRWSPDNTWLTYVGVAAGDSDIYVIRPDGSGQERVTFTSAEDNDPAWLGAAERVIFTGLRVRSYGPDYNLYTVAADGTDRRRLFIPGLSYPESPLWSTALDAVVFTARRRGLTDLYLVRLDGSGLRALTVGGLRNMSVPET
jgi:Tol biopolymer transport system component